ncbi:MAG: hypothetical protein COB76_02865 [Alphaproteobacteria bacterium]|nr:MAG: hypothetical protein COB76_05515 [Alphaproteobacteria bacterium]PCI00720.1 MAG: hypothetical protein COB76_02865 [Alphaproteobacteria bacterium]
MLEDMTKIDAKEIMEKDVKTMSYDDLMSAIRFLDQEREMLAVNINITSDTHNKFDKQEKINRAA